MPELAGAVRAGGEHHHPPVRRWWCLHPGCGASGVGGWAQLTEHHEQAHPRPGQERHDHAAARLDADPREEP